MKQFAISALALLASVVSYGQQKQPQVEWPDYEFTTVVSNPITPVKNQYRSGTCWCFSALGFLESEVIRINGIKNEADYPDFSEMFVVSHSYMDRAVKYVRLDGNLTFSAGSEADDVLHVVRDYGIVPQSAMEGMNYGTQLPVQGELDAVLKGYIQQVVKNPNKQLTTAWARGFQAILDEYLGKYPQKFEVGGSVYTPQQYRDMLNIKPEDYVSISSFTHHPFYSRFALEVSDNWRWDEVYNIPLDEFVQVLDDALTAGYTVEWGADVSYPGGFTRDGLAVLVDIKAAQTSGSDQEHWLGKEEGKKGAKADKKKKSILPPKEIEVTQESRQEGFDNKTTTDDHGMQIYGLARDQWGGKYYIVKNSWGEAGKFKGIWYVSEAYVMNQSMDIVVHKDAVPQALKDKLGIK